MRKHHALGAARRSSGVEQGGQIRVSAIDDLGRLGVLERRYRDRAFLLWPRTDDPFQVGQSGDRLTHDPDEFRTGDHRARARITDDVPELFRRQQEDRRRDRRPRAPERPVRHSDIGAVRHEHHDPVARRDPHLDQAAGHAPRALVKLAAPIPRALEQQRIVIAEARERLFTQAREVVLPDGHQAAAPRVRPITTPVVRLR